VIKIRSPVGDIKLGMQKVRKRKLGETLALRGGQDLILDG